MKSTFPAILSSTLLLAGCIAPKVTSPPAAAVNFREHQKVKIVLTDSVNTPSSQQAAPMFEGLLKGKLQSIGYTPVENDPEMVLDVKLTQFDLGDRALRMAVGHGAGRAQCKYTATVRDPSGSLLAQLQGGKMYHGQEVVDNPMLKSDEAMRMGMIGYSVSQIGRFIQSNGGRETN
jgi:hypothetical protein